MERPSKYQMLTKFFPDLGKGRGSENEAAVKLNTMACEAVLADLINLYDKGFVKQGLGCLCLRLHKEADSSDYLSLQDLQDDLDIATIFNDESMKQVFAEVIDKVESLNPDQCALVLLCDNTTLQLFPIDRNYPAKTIQSMLEEFGS